MNGVILIDKEKGFTSRDVVNKVGGILHTKKIGHTGTLDPLATGVLALAIGDGLKLVDMMVSDIKEYEAEVKMGVLTDTLDITGEVLKISEIISSKDKIIEVLNSFLGRSIQEVPLYSSVKVNGKRLYEYARSGKEVELPKREIEVFKIEFLSIKDDTFKFKVLVSKGTYIRSLIRDIGERLGICCTMSNLRRTRQGNFKIEDCFKISDIENGNYKVIPLKEVLDSSMKVEVNDYIEAKIKNGRILENRYDDERIVFVNKSGKILAIYEVYKKDPSKIKPWKVLSKQ